ncbi:hypothetical protein AB1N83_012673 [Pleurotus pulmonarius]
MVRFAVRYTGNCKRRVLHLLSILRVSTLATLKGFADNTASWTGKPDDDPPNYSRSETTPMQTNKRTIHITLCSRNSITRDVASVPLLRCRRYGRFTAWFSDCQLGLIHQRSAPRRQLLPAAHIAPSSSNI